MPTVTTTKSDITTEGAATALQAQLGDKYTVTVKDSGARQVLSVKQTTLAFASVHMVQEDGVTKFHVHGGGLIIGRLVNELGIARKIAAAIKASPELAG